MITLIGCGQGQNNAYITTLIAAFEIRVATDSGVYVNKPCQTIQLNKLNV